jgi:hypothetical protein
LHLFIEDGEIEMDVLLYADDLLTYGKYLREKIEAIAGIGHLAVCPEMFRLKDCLLSSGNRIKIGILCVRDEHELDRLVSMQSLFDHLFVILVLPYSDDNVIAKGHMLKPRFLAYAGAEFDDVVAVVNHLCGLGLAKTDRIQRDVWQ